MSRLFSSKHNIKQIIKKSKDTAQSANKSDAKRTILLRDFIFDRLYQQPDGYFCKEQHQVGLLKEQIKFSELTGYYEFRKEMERLYPENAWLTPSELFKPFYGYTIANFIAN